MGDRDGKKVESDESAPDRTQAMKPSAPSVPRPAARQAAPATPPAPTPPVPPPPGAEDRPFETTALIDAASMEGLQARSRSGSSMPPPPASDAQPTSVLDTGKLSELVGESSSGRRAAASPATPAEPAPRPDATDTVRPGKSANPAVASSGRGKYTPTLRSVDFDAKAAKPPIWPLLLGVVVFSAGVGSFLAARTLPRATAADTVELHVRAEPSTATLSLDGEPLAGNPHSSTRPRDDKRRSLLVEAEGHVAQTVDVVLDTSTAVDVSLRSTATDKADPTK